MDEIHKYKKVNLIIIQYEECYSIGIEKWVVKIVLMHMNKVAVFDEQILS